MFLPVNPLTFGFPNHPGFPTSNIPISLGLAGHDFLIFGKIW
jgi:hypothetical protein